MAKRLTILILLLTSHSLVGQETPVIDSLKLVVKKHLGDTSEAKALNELCYQYKYISKDSAFKYGELGVALSEKLESHEQISVGYSNLAECYTNDAKYKAALHFYQKSLEIDEREGKIADTYLDKVNIAIAYQKMGDYDQALGIFLDCLKYYEEKKDSGRMTIINFSIGNNFGYQEETKKAEQYYKTALNISKEINDSVMFAHCLDGLGVNAVRDRKFKLAESYFEEALNVAQKTGDQYLAAAVYSNIGFMKEELSDLKGAAYYYQKAIDISDEIGDVQGTMISLFNLATVYSNIGEYDKSQKYYGQVVDMATEAGAKQILSHAYRGLAVLNKEMGNFKSAFEYQELFSDLRDSLLNEQRVATIEELNAIYESEKRENQIAILEKENQIVEAKSVSRTYLLIGAISVFSILSLSIFLYFRQARARQKQEIVELEQQVLRTQINPHFIFNSFNSIQRLFMEGKTTEASDYMADFATLMRSTLDNSNLKQITLKEELELLDVYVQLERLRSQNGFDFELVVDTVIDPASEKIPPMILQPLVENAIWHGLLPKDEPGKIAVIVEKDHASDQLTIHIEDNGVGFDNSKGSTHESKGIDITQKRLRTPVRIETIATGGTRITIKV